MKEGHEHKKDPPKTTDNQTQTLGWSLSNDGQEESSKHPTRKPELHGHPGRLGSSLKGPTPRGKFTLPQFSSRMSETSTNNIDRYRTATKAMTMTMTMTTLTEEVSNNCQSSGSGRE